MLLRRLAIAGIVSFWLLMNVSLVRLWLYPETSEVLAIPVSHVAKLLFIHEQPSELTINQDGARVGGLTFRPRRLDAEGLREVAMAGSMDLKIPLTPKQTISWSGTATMDRAFALRELKLHIDIRTTKIVADLDLQPARNLGTIHVQQYAADVANSTFTLDQKGAQSILKQVGLDPSVVDQVASAVTGNVGVLTTAARQSQIKIHGENMEVFHVTVRQGADPKLEADVSQLGQVLAIKTAFGYSLSTDDNLP